MAELFYTINLGTLSLYNEILSYHTLKLKLSIVYYCIFIILKI